MDKSATDRLTFSGYEKFVIAILAFLQFTIILDFMIISPLGAIMMPTLRMSPQQFGLAVSSYAFSAGVSGLASPTASIASACCCSSMAASSSAPCSVPGPPPIPCCWRRGSSPACSGA
jgi:hypothetical protein